MAPGNWNEHALLVLAKLDEHGAELKAHREILTSIDKDVTALKVRASLWGFVAGAVPGMVAALFAYLKH